MSPEPLSCLERETGPQPQASVIWLHGLGADGSDFVPIIPELALPRDLAIRFVFPHAPVRPVTINNGMRMRAWYDIAATDLTNRADVAGVKQSASAVEALIERERSRGVPPEKIVLAGFSQGGAIALYAGLRYRLRLAGIMALSTYLIGPDTLATDASPDNRRVPIFMAHGTADPVVRFAWGEASKRLLEAQGYAIEWHSYPMEHSVCIEEVRDIGTWLARVVS
jgi:phospholipase/carboxylesterase